MVKTRLEPLERDIALMIQQTLSPEAQSAMIAEAAETAIQDAREVNARVLGRIPREKTTVDGREGAPLESVRPNGIIITEFELGSDVLIWIGAQLETHSPVGSRRDPHPGLYRKSHTVFADGVEVDVGATLPPAEEFVFINLVPYARKLELGSSSQAPDGVYQAVAVLAARRYGNIASIKFSYRTAAQGAIIGGSRGSASKNRQPAIVVRMR